MQKITFIIVIALFVTSAFPVLAAPDYTSSTVLKTATFRFNNQNWFTETHPRISEFTVTESGDSYGYTETGVFFRQFAVSNQLGIRIQRFEIQDHYHYIVEGEPVYSLEEVSAQLALAFTTQKKNTL